MMTPIQRAKAGEINALKDAPLTSDVSSAKDRWVEILSHLSPKYGGLTASVPQLCRKLTQQENFRIDVASFTRTDESADMDNSGVIGVTHWPASRAAWFLDKKLRKRFCEFIREARGLHLHGIWEVHTMMAGSIARHLGKPYIVSAHGMLDPWALAHKGWKKRVYAWLTERRTLEGAACLHALTVAEALDYRRFGSIRPIAVIPNGIDLPRVVNASIFLERHPELRGKRIILFLGRIHFKKGLDILVEAWATVHAAYPNAVLVLAGPDSQNSREAIEQLVESAQVSDTVAFTGMLSGPYKWSALANAHAFVLPSYSEGLSVAVLEAMGMGVPVIVSHECHMPEVETFRAGWQIDANAQALASALHSMLRNSAAANAEIGNRGRHLVRDRFTSETVTQQMADLYRWVQGGPRPRNVALLEVNA